MKTRVLALVLALATVGRAESLPTRGTFSGIYHENRAGVGHFKFFIASSALKPRLAPYEGKYIELEVLEGRQPYNPGPAIIDKIGKIEELTPAPLEIEINALVSRTGDPETFDVMYAFRNTGNMAIVLEGGHLCIALLGYLAVGKPGEINRDFGGYSSAQLAYGTRQARTADFVVRTHSGERTYSHVGDIRLQPGEVVQFVWNDVCADPGQYELQVSAIYTNPTNVHIPITLWKSLELPLSKTKEAAHEALTARMNVTRQEEWITLEGRLHNSSGKPRNIFVLPDGEHDLLPGLVQLYGRNGEEFRTDLEPRYPVGPWIRRSIDETGIPIRFRVRPKDHFSSAPPDHVGLWIVTENGLEKIIVATDLPAAPAQPAPDWGKKAQGCRCRIRLAKERVNSNEPIRVFFQAESDGTTADILWLSPDGATVEIDGKPAQIESTGLPDNHVLSFPRQAVIKLASDQKLAAGIHKLRVRIEGEGGTYTNLKNVKSRKFEGVLLSNEIDFHVGD